MKKLLVVLLLVFAASMAFADTAQVQFIDNPYGVPGPYIFNVTQPYPGGTPSLQSLICWSDFNPVPSTPTLYMVYTIGTVPSPGPFGESPDQYAEIAYLAAKLFADPGNPDIQVAIWLAAGLYNPGNTLKETALADQYWQEAIDAVTNNGYTGAGAVFYLPLDDTGKLTADGPQPLVGFVPEPGSLLLLGTGILGAAGAIRRRLSI